jgi:hypothetical protein
MRADGYFKRSFDIRAHRRRSDNPKSSRLPPQVCLVSKGFRDETVGVFMRNSTFTICSIFENIFLRKLRRGQRRGQRRCIARARTCLRQLRLLPRVGPAIWRVDSGQLGPRARSRLQRLAHGAPGDGIQVSRISSIGLHLQGPLDLMLGREVSPPSTP